MALRTLASALAAVLFVAFASHGAGATAIVSWRFVPEVHVVSLTDEVLLTAVVSNDALATEPVDLILLGIRGIAGPIGSGHDLRDVYNVVFDPLVPDPSGTLLAPGESYEFTWARLTPLFKIAPGTYAPLRAAIGAFNAPGEIDSDNLFSIQVVPEPGTVLLVATGMAWLAVSGRRGGPGGRARSARTVESYPATFRADASARAAP